MPQYQNLFTRVQIIAPRWREDLALDAAGKFLALDVHYDANFGAYLSGRSPSMVGNAGGLAGVYVIPAIAAEIRGEIKISLDNERIFTLSARAGNETATVSMTVTTRLRCAVAPAFGSSDLVYRATLEQPLRVFVLGGLRVHFEP